MRWRDCIFYQILAGVCLHYFVYIKELSYINEYKCIYRVISVDNWVIYLSVKVVHSVWAPNRIS